MCVNGVWASAPSFWSAKIFVLYKSYPLLLLRYPLIIFYCIILQCDDLFLVISLLLWYLLILCTFYVRVDTEFFHNGMNKVFCIKTVLSRSLCCFGLFVFIGCLLLLYILCAFYVWADSVISCNRMNKVFCIKTVLSRLWVSAYLSCCTWRQCQEECGHLCSAAIRWLQPTSRPTASVNGITPQRRLVDPYFHNNISLFSLLHTHTHTYIYTERERERGYNKVQACFVLETFYSEFSPLGALSRPGWLDWLLGISQANWALTKPSRCENLE